MNETTLVKFEASTEIAVTDSDSYVAVCERRKTAKGFIKAAHEKFDGDISVSDKHHKSLVAKLREIITPAEMWIKKADNMLNVYNAEQERIRQQAEIAAQQAAHKAEGERKLAEAVALEAQGDKQGAEEVIAEPVYVPPVVVAKTVPKVQGVSFTERWTYRIVDEKQIPRIYLKPDTVKLGHQATSMKGAANVPGVEFYSTKGVSGKG